MSTPIKSVLYKVSIKDLDIKKMPNDEEYYFTLDLVGNKKVHRSKYIKTLPSELRFVFLEKEQL